ncbi:hypothetical protein D3C85_1232100 [compost metagenome]
MAKGGGIIKFYLGVAAYQLVIFGINQGVDLNEGCIIFYEAAVEIFHHILQYEALSLKSVIFSYMLARNQVIIAREFNMKEICNDV